MKNIVQVNSVMPYSLSMHRLYSLHQLPHINSSSLLLHPSKFNQQASKRQSLNNLGHMVDFVIDNVKTKARQNVGVFYCL